MPATFEPAGAPGALIPQTLSAMGQAQSLMQRAQQMSLARQTADEKAQAAARDEAQFQILRPLLEADMKTKIVKAETDYAGQLNLQSARQNALKLYDKANQDFDFMNNIEDATARANASREWLSRYSQLSNVAELKGEMDVKNHLATENMLTPIKLLQMRTAQERAFDGLVKDMTPEDAAKARDVKAGLAARAVTGAAKTVEVKLPDGRSATMVFNPSTMQLTVPETVDGKSGTGTASNPFTSATPGEVEGQKQSADLTSKLKAEQPKRLVSMKRAEAVTGQMVSDLDDLITRVTASTAGPGGVLLEKFPGTTAKDLSSDLNAIKANIGFQTLQAMREASPTGGALGQVSDGENKLLQSVLGSLEIGQSPTQFVKNLRKVRDRVQENYGITRSAYVQQFGAPDVATPDTIKNMSDEDIQKRLRELGR